MLCDDPEYIDLDELPEIDPDLPLEDLKRLRIKFNDEPRWVDYIETLIADRIAEVEGGTDDAL